jgi:hypothetical protein
MISGSKLLKLYENEANTDGNFKSKVRGLFGLVEDELGRETFDKSKSAVDPKEFSLEEMAYSIIGRDFATRLKAYNQSPHRVQEAEGGVVLPSHFSNINAFTASVHGLLDALVMQAYQLPEFIGDDFCTTYPTRVNGGKMIGVKLDGSEIDQTPLTSGLPYPTVGLVEDWVNIPENERRGLTIQLNLETIIYDRTDQIQSAAEIAGRTIAYNRERKIARMVLGIDNPYARLDTTNNTYQSTAGAVPHNFVNEMNLELQDYRDIDAIIRLLGRNRCPATTFPIAISLQDAILHVMPANVMTAQRIARTTEVASVSPDLILSRSNNPLDASFRTSASFIWYHTMVDAGYDPDDFNSMWVFGDPKKAFGWRELVPFGVEDAVLSSEDLRRDIVMVKVARQIGIPFVKEPRYVARGADDMAFIDKPVESPSV